MIDLGSIPEVMLKERAEQLGSAVPETVTIKVSKQLGLLLTTQAEVYDRDVDYIARQLLEGWAERWVKTTFQTYNELQAARLETAEPKKRRNEHYYKCELAASLRRLGLNILTEHHTGNGDADIAIMGSDCDTVLSIVEVKLSLKNWRECHQATGQAKAYAEATGAASWFVVAPLIEDDRLVSENVLRYDGAASVIVAAIKKVA